jgi:hypothetical protein
MQLVPHIRVVVAACAVAVVGYAAVSAYVLLCMDDAAMKGDVVGTWKSFAALAFAFWVGSSSAGKAKDDGKN